jgi:integrase
VPLQAIALAALDQFRGDRESHFPSLDPRRLLRLHNFRNRYWKPAQIAADIAPLRRVYDLRHTFATSARAGFSTFNLSRYMGASLTMIDRHYGHLARDGREHAIRLFDGYADITPADVQDLDVGWTPQLPIVACGPAPSGADRVSANPAGASVP